MRKARFPDQKAIKAHEDFAATLEPGNTLIAVAHPLYPRLVHLVRGRVDGAVYVSISIECDAGDGSMASRTAAVINDTEFDVDREGRFELRLGGKPAARNWLALDPAASRLTTRHYYENEVSAAVMTSKDAREGPRAFKEKRKPVFTGE